MRQGQLELAMFGAFDVRLDGEPVNLGLVGATRSLLQYLLCNGDRLARRELLMEMFWGDTSPERRRSSLNTAIWRIKKAMRAIGAPGTFSLDASADCLRLTGLGAPGIEIDSVILGDALALASTMDAGDAEIEGLVAAVGKCCGIPLDGLDDPWAQVQRERLSDLRTRAQNVAMRLLAAQRRFDEALELGHRILADDPYHESALQEVLCLHALNGQRVRALRLFDEFARTLQSELGIPPMPETRALRDYLAGDIACAGRMSALAPNDRERVSVQPSFAQLVSRVEHSRVATGLYG